MEEQICKSIKSSIKQNKEKLPNIPQKTIDELAQMGKNDLIKVLLEIILDESTKAYTILDIFKLNINFVLQNLKTQEISNSKRILVDKKLAEMFFMFPYAKENILSFYEDQKQSYNYDPIQLMLQMNKEKVNIEMTQQVLVNLCIFLNMEFNAFRNIWDVPSLFKKNKQYLQYPQLRGFYLNIILKFTKQFTSNEKEFLKQCYQIQDEQKLNELILLDSLKVSNIFQELQQQIQKKLQQSLQIQQEMKENKNNSENKSVSDEDIENVNKKRKLVENNDDDEEEFLVQKKNKDESQDSNSKNENIQSDQIVITDIEINELTELQKLILSSEFVVIDGPLSSGKSEYVEYLKNLHQNQIITLFIDYSTDLKSLLGSYVCTEKIGQFEWKDGPLVKAMEEGKWLVFKNFQEANEEIINGLLQIAQTNTYNLTSQGRKIQGHFRFKIIGIGSFGKDTNHQKKLTLRNSTTYFEKKAFDIDHLKKVLMSKFPLVFKYDDSLIFDKVIEATMALKKSLRQNQSFILNVNKMLALFKRIEFHIKKVYGEEGIENKILTEEFRKILYMETCDLLILCDRNALNNEKLHQNILKIFQLTSVEYELCMLKYDPEINLDSKQIKLGKLGTFSRNLYMNDNQVESGSKFQEGNTIVYNPYSSRLLEKIASCIYFDEPCLLVGDTGCGKTTMAQHCAEIFKKTLHIYNMSQGSDAIDLIGGFKPIDVRILLKNLIVKYVKYFGKIVNMSSNKAYLDNLKNLFQTKQYIILMKCMLDSFSGIFPKLQEKFKNNEEERLKIHTKFTKLQKKIENIYVNRDKIESNLAFSFIEGNLIKAIKHGDWILIDEINLANNEVLQKLLPIIEGKSLVLYERGDLREIKRHPDFRILTCMNPGSDIGKKELPNNIKQKFTEIFVHDIEYDNDLLHFVKNKVKGVCEPELAEKIVFLFQDIKKACKENLLEDGYNKRQHVSLRNLSRALNYVKSNRKTYGIERCLYDGLYLGFGTALSKTSQKYFEGQMESIIGVSSTYYNKQLLSLKPKIPQDCVELYGFFLKKGGDFGKIQPEEFLVTDTFRKYIIDLLRAIAHTDLPVLLEGPTSSGKTSIVKYIASVCGYKCVRVNNHQHTDIEEYIGTYLPDNKGRLVFQEGVLIEAMKKGHWLILDELNLARSEILESLNRLLDDNKEIFINETQTYVKPHPNFRLFATQNPTTYGGRKELSKAFKNRFIQLYFDEICEEDLELILQKRCVIAPSYCKRLMNILKDLKVFRQRQNFFMGKEGVITVRDLIKWGQREVTSLEQLGIEGYCILAERLRSEEERKYIKKIIEKHLKISFDIHQYYTQYTTTNLDPYLKDFPYYLQINQSFRRMATLALKAIQQNEPVLLIGETGCGKTTVSQLIAHIRKVNMHSINCHQYTESSDFLGSLRPVRQKPNPALQQFIKLIEQNDSALYKVLEDQTIQIEKRIQMIKKSENEIIKQQVNSEQFAEIEAALIQQETLFEWQDGPLVQAMGEGAVFLIDEISLAEDSVLERLNSVLEPSRSLLLPEKGSQNLEEIVAKDGFLIISTMNPGGDFGKKELSPALRNRFTEIWVEPITAKAYLEIQTTINENDVYNMITEYLTVKKVFNEDQQLPRNALAEALFDFLRFFNLQFVTKYSLEKRSLTMRDILAIMELIVQCRKKTQLDLSQLYYHSIDLVVLEAIGFLSISQNEKQMIRQEIMVFINNQIEKLKEFISNNQIVSQNNMNNQRKVSSGMEIESQNVNQVETFGIHPFRVNKGNYQQQCDLKINSINEIYSLSTDKVKQNLVKLMRGLQLDKSILLEGLPGVGKTSLIEYVAFMSNRKLVKISLSEQTDIVDLLGSDLPVSSHNEDEEEKEEEEIIQKNDTIEQLKQQQQNGENMEIENLKTLDKQQKKQKKKQASGNMRFKWYDGVLLDALKTGKWILLDELNLASQTILEGLNAILDHRGTVFIPEMNESFVKHPDFRIFACQNPMQIGGGRKGLPSSFLSRFTKIYFEEFNEADLVTILKDLKYINEENEQLLTTLILFILNENTGNLRDMLRFCEIYENNPKKLKMAIDLAFLEKERSEYRREDLRNILKSKYLKDIYQNAVEVKVCNSEIPQNYNFQQNLFKTVFIPNNLLNSVYQIYEVLKNQRSIMVSGAKGSGKSEIVRLLQSLKSSNGKVVNLQEISLNSQVDSTELIGAYDQVDLKRQFSLLCEQFSHFLHKTFEHTQIVDIKFFILEILEQLEINLNSLYLQEETENTKMFQAEKNLLSFISKQVLKLKKLNISVSDTLKEYISQLKHYFDQTQDNNFKGNFDWFFSNIIRSVKQGDWLVLDNVQNANQAVLARLNPLLEKPLFQETSKLVITECHQQENEILEIEVHPDFKLFLLWDTSSNAAENLSLSNKCTQINLDQFYNDSTQEKYKSDLIKFLKYKFGENTSQDLQNLLVQKDLEIQDQLPQHLPLEFRSFDKFLETVRSSAFESQSDYFNIQIEKAFNESYVSKLEQTKMGSMKTVQQKMQEQEQQDNLKQQMLKYKETTDNYIQQYTKEFKQLFVNQSNFHIHHEIFSQSRKEILEKLKQSIEQEIKSHYGENETEDKNYLDVETIKHKVDLIYYIDKNLFRDNEIQSLQYKYNIYMQMLEIQSQNYLKSIKILQKQNQYTQNRNLVIGFFKDINKETLDKQKIQDILQILDFLIQNIGSLSQYIHLIIPHVTEYLKIENISQNFQIISEQMKLKQELWKCSLFYQELPKSKQQDFMRKIVKFFMGENVSNEILLLEQEFQQDALNQKLQENNNKNTSKDMSNIDNSNQIQKSTSQYFDMQNLFRIRKIFQNVYFVESKSREISLEMFNYISKVKTNDQEEKIANLFNTFVNEIERMLNQNEFFQNQDLYEKQYMITIEDEYEQEILKQIPIFVNEQSVQYYTLKFRQSHEEQSEKNGEQLLLNTQQRINTKQFEDFTSFLAYSNASMLCLSSEAQKAEFPMHLKQILSVVDIPDIVLVKIQQFLKKYQNITIPSIAEVYVLSRIKNSQYQEIQFQDLAKSILNINIKCIPFLSNLVLKVQKVLDYHLKLVQSFDAKADGTNSFNKNYQFFDDEKTNLAQKWIYSVLGGVFNITQENNNNIIEQIVEIQELGEYEFVRGNLIALNTAIENKEIGKIGYEILNLFGFQEDLSENLSVILKEEMLYQIKNTENTQKMNKISAQIYEGSNISNNYFDVNSHRYNKKIGGFKFLQDLLKQMKEKIVHRGNKSNAEELEYFFQQNQIFISRIKEQNLQEQVNFQIEEFYQNLAAQRMTNQEFKEKMEEESRKMQQIVQHIDNFLQVSYNNFYLNFSDFLIPYYFGLLFVKDHILGNIRNIQQSLITRRFKRMRYQLLSQNYKEKVENLENFVSADLKNVDIVLNEVFDTQKAFQSGCKKSLQNDHKQLFKRIMDFCEENLLKKEEIDKFKEDDAKRFIVFQKKIQDLIVDEYTQDAVEKQKKEELLEIQKQFNTYANDFQSFIETGGDMKEQLEKQKADIEYQDSMDKLDVKSKESLQSYIFQAVLSILKKDSNILMKNQQRKYNRYLDIQNKNQHFAQLGLQFIQNQVINSDFQIHDLNSSCEFLIFVKNYTSNHDFARIMLQEIEDQFNKPNIHKLKAEDKEKEKEKQLKEEKETKLKYNVYKDAVQEETSLIYKPLNLLLQRVNELLHTEEFDNNQVLQNLAILIDYMLESNFNNLKLAKLITGIQFIVEKANEWDISVPVMFGLKAQTQDLINLLLKWRIKEKSGWKILLDDKEREVQEQDIIMFLKLRQLLIQYVVDNADEKEFYSLCFQFISSSTMGTMQMRLYMLRYIAFYDLPNNPRQRVILESISQYFSMFEEEYVTKMENECNQFESEIEEYRRLAGWDSKNYMTLKATLEKFHKKVFRICKRYKDFMQEPTRVHVFEAYRKRILMDNFETFYTNFLQKNFERKIFEFFDIDEIEREEEQQRQQKLIQDKIDRKREKEEKKQRAILNGEFNQNEEEENSDDDQENELINYQMDLTNTLQEQFFQIDFKKLGLDEESLENNQILKRGLNLLSKNQLVLLNCSELEQENKKNEKNQKKKKSRRRQNQNSKEEELPFLDLRIVKLLPQNSQFEKEKQISSYLYIEELIGDVFDRVNMLKDDEKSTKVSKLRAVQDLFKQLKFFGFTSFYKTSLHQNKTEIYEFENIPEEFTNGYIKNTEKHYYDILDRISTYKTNSTFAKDLSGEYIRRGGGYMIEFFYFLRGIYANHSEFLSQFKTFKKNVEQAQFIKGEESVVKDVDNNKFWKKLEDLSFSLEQIIQIFGQVVKEGFQEFVSELNDLKNKKFVDLDMEHKNIVTVEYLGGLISDFNKLQDKAIISVQGLKGSVKIEEYILIKDQVQVGIVQVLEDSKQLANKYLTDNIMKLLKEGEQQQSEQDGEILNSTQILIQNIIKGVQVYKSNIWQNIQKQQDLFTDKDFLEKNKDILNQNSNLKKNEEQYLKKITTSLANFNNKNIQIVVSQNNLDLLNLVNTYLEGINIYSAKALSAFAKFGNILSGIMLNLFYKGFCHPDKEGEGGEGNQEGGTDFKEGTGIGEGKGAQNVTDEMQFEEQMLGMKDEDQQDQDEIEEDQKDGDNEKKDKDFEMDQDFQGRNDDLNEKEKEEEKEKDQENENDEFDDVDDEQLDPKMWEGDDDEKSDDDEDEGQEDKKQNRRQDDLQFNQKNNKQDQEDETLQAKEKEKDKDKQRNIDDFEKNEKEEKERDLNQEEINELNKDDADFEDRDYDNLPEGEKLDEDKAAGEDMELEDENQLPEEEGDENLQEFEQDGKEEEEEELGSDFDNEQMGDPLDQVEESYDQKKDEMEEEEELEKYPDQVEKQNEEEDEEDEQAQGGENQDQMEEEDKKDLDDKKKRPDNQAKNKKDKRFGVQDQNNEDENNDDIQQEDNMDQQNDEEQNKNQENQQDGDQKGETQEDATNQKQNDFSSDFLKEMEKTMEAFDKQNFIRDLNVVQENEEKQENKQNQINPDDVNENQEFEAIEFEDMNEVNNAVATNIRKDQTSKNEEQAKQSDINKEDQQQEEKQQNQEDRENLKKDENSEEMEKEKKQKLDQNKSQQQQQNNEEQKNKDKMEEEVEDKMIFKPKETNFKFESKEETTDKPKKDNMEEEQDDSSSSDDENELDPDNIEKTDQAKCKLEVQDLVRQFREDKKAQNEGMKIWQKMEQETRYYSMMLSEELKAILEPQQIQNFKGDYKSGKRLNMKKIINYIASNFRKNKIWLRRNAPSKRTYQIMLGIDDSYSMQEQNVGYLALQSLTTVSLAMSKMEVGELAISAMHERFKLIHPLNQPLTPADVPFILQQFKFDYQDTNSSDLSLPNYMRGAIDMFTEVKQRDSQQICFIISDGRFNKKMVKSLLSEAEENNILFVFIILDNKKEEKQSIMNIKSTSHSYVDGKLKIKMTHYLSDFPFQYYIVVEDVFELSKVLVDILRQYFEIERK